MKDTPWFRHDADARNDPKLIALIKDYGMQGYAYWWIVLENLRASDGYKMKYKQYVIDALSHQMMCSCDNVERFLDNCVGYELLTKDKGFIFSQPMINRMKEVQSKSTKCREAAEKRWEKEKNPDIKRFLDYWNSKYVEKFGEKYISNYAKDGYLVKIMLESVDFDNLKKRADAFFLSTKEFIQEAGYTIGVFSSQINKLEGIHEQDDITRKYLRRQKR